MGGWLAGIFEWLKDEGNREVLGWLGGGLIALLGFILARRNKQTPAKTIIEMNPKIKAGGNVNYSPKVTMGDNEDQGIVRDAENHH